MTHAEYMRAQAKILKSYQTQKKVWAQAGGDMHLALLRDKNEQMCRLASYYHTQNTAR